MPAKKPEVVQIKKYPNRRYYDAARSQHVTLQDVHDIILDGRDVCVTDSRTGDDITNLVLTQVLLEKDQPKLDLFPSSILHAMIRSNRQVLRSSLERFFGPFYGLLATSQKQFDAYLRQAMPGGMVSPLDWANNLMQTFSGSAAKPRPVDPEPPAPRPPDRADLDELRRQLAALQRRVEELSAENRRDTP